MFTWHKTGAMSGWNEKRIVNPSSADLAHAMPNVTHDANINPNVAHIAPYVTRAHCNTRDTARKVFIIRSITRIETNLSSAFESIVKTGEYLCV